MRTPIFFGRGLTSQPVSAVRWSISLSYQVLVCVACPTNVTCMMKRNAEKLNGTIETSYTLDALTASDGNYCLSPPKKRYFCFLDAQFTKPNRLRDDSYASDEHGFSFCLPPGTSYVTPFGCVCVMDITRVPTWGPTTPNDPLPGSAEQHHARRGSIHSYHQQVNPGRVI